MKKRQFWSFVASWIIPEDIMLSKISIEKQILHDLTSMLNLKMLNSSREKHGHFGQSTHILKQFKSRSSVDGYS